MKNNNWLKIKDITKMVAVYRYISLIVASCFYVFSVQGHSLERKVFIVAGITITALIMEYLYVQNRGSSKRIASLIVIETLGNVFLLIASGGFQSAYVWYVLNTVIIAAINKNCVISCINMAVYLVGIIMTSKIYYLEPYAQKALLLSNMNVMLGLILTMVIIQLLVKYGKEIMKKNEEIVKINDELTNANQKVEETLDYTMKMYEAVHLFSAQNNVESLSDLILDYALKILDIKGAMFIKVEDKQEHFETYAKQIDKGIEEQLLKRVKEGYQDKKDKLSIWYIELEGALFTCVNIKYTYMTFGTLVIEGEEDLEKVGFITQLSGMLFKRFKVEELNDMLIIEKEQNRIANEIHDSVLQKLFGVTCNLFALSKTLKNKSIEDMVEVLDMNRESINHAMTELRQTIYGLSWNKKGSTSFQDKIEAFIEEMQSLQNVKIDFNAQGDLQQLTIKEQTSLYRILCEGISNAIRHGKAKNIEVILSVAYEEIRVVIEDNGRGFDIEKTKQKGGVGLGIHNMESLSIELGGNTEIESKFQEGTKIEVVIPNTLVNRRREII